MSLSEQNLFPEFLEPFRSIGDPHTDKLISRIFATETQDLVSTLMQHLNSSSDVVPAGLPSLVHDFFSNEDGLLLPQWANPEQMALGAHVFTRYSPEIITVLHCASLPVCYAARRGVQVLGVTKRLEVKTKRRLLETAQFLLDVMDGQGFTMDGSAIRTCQKVRLLHAAIRHHLRSSDTWKPDYGVPINQEDLALTLMSFSVTVIECMQKLGVPLNDDQSAAYLHLWKVIGYFMGVDERLLPEDLSAALALTRAIQQHQYGRSEAGMRLTQALLRHMQQQIPGGVLDGFPGVLMRFLLGDEYADILGVPGSDPTMFLLLPYKVLLAAGEHAAGQCRNLEWLETAIGNETLRYVHDRVLHKMHFEMSLPRTATEDWHEKDGDRE